MTSAQSATLATGWLAMTVSSVTLNTIRRSERASAARRVQRAVTTLSKAALHAHVSTAGWQVVMTAECLQCLLLAGCWRVNQRLTSSGAVQCCWCTCMSRGQCATLDTRYPAASARSARKESTLQAARMPLAHLAPRAGPTHPLARLTAQVSCVVLLCDVWHRDVVWSSTAAAVMS